MKENNEFAPFRLVGQTRPGWFYARTNPTRHAIYDRVIAILENRTLQHVRTGDRLPFALHPMTVNSLRAEGTSELEIEQGESTLINTLEMHPCWNVWYDVSPGIYHQLKRDGQEEAVFEHRIVGVPGTILNALLCEKLLTMFRRADLLATPGFIDRDGDLRLDIDPYLARQGFIVPVIRKGLIDALRVFRRPGDTRPFVLRSRGIGLNA